MLNLHCYERSVRGWGGGSTAFEHPCLLEKTVGQIQKVLWPDEPRSELPFACFYAALGCSREPCCILSEGLWQTCSVQFQENSHIYVPACHPVHVETLANPRGRETSHAREICSVLDAYCRHWNYQLCSFLWIIWIGIRKISFYHF